MALKIMLTFCSVFIFSAYYTVVFAQNGEKYLSQMFAVFNTISFACLFVSALFAIWC